MRDSGFGMPCSRTSQTRFTAGRSPESQINQFQISVFSVPSVFSVVKSLLCSCPRASACSAVPFRIWLPRIGVRGDAGLALRSVFAKQGAGIGDWELRQVPDGFEAVGEQERVAGPDEARGFDGLCIRPGANQVPWRQ